jgi:O-antigen ligase
MNAASAKSQALRRPVGRPYVSPPIVLGVALALAAGLIAPLALAKSLPIVAGLTLISLLALRLDELLTVLIVAFIVLIEFYGLLGYFNVPMSALIVLIFIGVILWGRPRWLRLVRPYAIAWIPIILLGGLRVLGSPALREALYYYLDVIVAPLLMLLLGMLVARDTGHFRRLLTLLAVFGGLLAVHSIIQSSTGIFLLETQRQSDYLSSTTGFALSGSGVSRAGSFLLNPDWNGAFLALMIFPPLGLFFSATSWGARVFSVITLALIAAAMLLTYTASAWLASAFGLLVFLWLGMRGRTRWYTLGAIGVVGATAITTLHHQFLLLYQHATGNNEVSLRVGAWETALRVIQHYPLWGIGYGQVNYLTRAEPYRVALQVVPLAHPHNAYLELAALGGIPLLLLFLLVLGIAARAAARTLRQVPPHDRPLVACVLASLAAFALVNMAINGWTLQPLAAIAWLLLGAAASPLLTRSLSGFSGPAALAHSARQSSGVLAPSNETVTAGVHS